MPKSVVNKYVSKDVHAWAKYESLRWKGAGEYAAGVRTAETGLVRASGNSAANAAAGAVTTGASGAATQTAASKQHLK